MRTVFSVFVLLILSSATLAQESVAPSGKTAQPPSSNQSTGQQHDGPAIRHITDSLLQSPEAREALEAFQRTREQPGVASAKPAQEYTVGDVKDFNVFHIDDTRWMEDIPFVLKRKSPALYLWVEQAELDSNYVRDRDADNLFRALQERTPRGSVDPNEGIIVNNNDIFGSPSDIDGNDRVHILLTDIKDGREEDADAPYVGGFFHPTDLNPNNSSGNQGEVLYLDTRPGIYTDEGNYHLGMRVRATAAHEYQHLIHANYDINEVLFINEGLSEWAEIINGYPRRPADYLSNPDDSTGYNIYLFDWRRNSDNVLYDYQRAGLLTHYLAEQIGVMDAGALTRSNKRGVSGYNAVLENRDFQEFLLDFHTANSLNNVEYDSEYGYIDEGRQGLGAAPTFSYDSRIDQHTPETTSSINAGAVQYLEWNYVENLTVTIDGQRSDPGQNIHTIRERLRVRAIAERPDGSISTRTFSPEETVTFDGEHDRVTLVVAHVKPQERETRIKFSAEWTQREQTFARALKQYDNGVPYTDDGQRVFFLTGADNNGITATRFPVPDPPSAILSKVSFAFYFFSQFSNGPSADSPRDFTLHVWGNSANRTPGQKIFSLTMDDPRSYTSSFSPSSYNRFEIDLADYEDQLSNLPDTIFVGAGEAGTDNNHMVLAPAPYTNSNTSFIGNAAADDTAWTPLWGTELENGIALDQTTLPTRAEFLVADTTADDPGDNMPSDSLVLASNYPNPFNSTTEIQFNLPEEGPVRLEVYDILGRHVTTLVDEIRIAGPHTESVDAGDWASGVYFYLLQYNGQRLSRKMMLVK